ncbi:MFS general substrate transporter [Stereum hirsutum FP-91666 SS1]|uniref:MFS general substrate transporter n=1 Tax=Stereum hirsutum (strain FP-91666) TaxID=721885 RepID=UPI000440C850|nr:MFS general substrate transporter [Stereum hirsutum FP-91666 SS1]EIM90087.1 MFS general substrate transporter [Stereum hirsutum FP-91666 SS1]
MSGLKKTTINARAFYPEEVEQDHLEHVGADTPGAGASSGAGGSTEKSHAYDDSKIILVTFEEGDPENPMNWGKGRKWMTTALLCFMTLTIGLSTSAYSSGITSMTEEFGVSTEAGEVGMFMFNAACAFAPLFLAPFCELVGRRYIYLGSFGCFTLIFILLAMGKNIGSELVGRLLSGLFGCVGTILVGGTLADIWETKERSVPMACFSYVAILGTIAAPLYCGYIDAAIGWRWIEWIHMIASGVLFILELIFFKETRGAAILKTRAKRLRKETGDNRLRAPIELEAEKLSDLLHQSSTRAIYLTIREPVIFFFGFWIAFAWGITFLFLSVIPLTFQDNHGWAEGNGGLPYIALIIGTTLGFISGFWQDAKYDAVREANGGVAIPEARLYGAMIGGPFLPIGLFIYSWTQFGFVHWIAPCIALVLIIFGIYHIFLAVYNYTADSYGELSSSAIAGQGWMRNMLGAVTPLFANQMFNGMGYQWAGTLLALIACLITPLPFICFAYGDRIRASSKYAAAATGAVVPEKKQADFDDMNEKGKAVDNGNAV